MGKTEALKKVKQEAENCIACDLWLERNKLVFGEGSVDADIMFIGEAGGKEEDQSGHPFCGRSGKLLTKIINNISLNREDVFILNILKCHPPNNRDPFPNEVKACIGFLEKQIEIIKPKVIVLLGAVALKSLFNNNSLSIVKNRGIWREYKNIPVMPTYHPAYLLYRSTEENKNKVKNDLRLVLEKIKSIDK